MALKSLNVISGGPLAQSWIQVKPGMIIGANIDGIIITPDTDLR